MTAARNEARGLKVAEYRTRAQEAALTAAACNLTRVKESHERSAAVWISLAEAAERREAARSDRGTLASADAV